MFVVTGLHSKRRPYTGTVKFSATIRKQGIEKPSLAVSNSNRHPRRVTVSASSLAWTAPRVSEPRMTRNDIDKDACNRNYESGQTVKLSLGRVAPPRVRRFIPKPLILVERVKARQLLLDWSLPDASDSRVVPGSLTRSKTAMTTPLSTHVTPPHRRQPTCSTLSSDSHSSSTVSFLLSLRNDGVFGSGFGMMPRVRVRPLSGVTLGDCSTSTDTFVADSPCFVKRASSKLPLLATTTDTAQVHLDVESDPGEQDLSHASFPVLLDSVAADFVQPTCQLSDTFEPPKTSTPFASSQPATHHGPSPIGSITSAVCPTRIPEPTPANGASGSFEIASPTSCPVYHLNSPTDAYVVKLPDFGSAVSLSSGTRLASSLGTVIRDARLPKSCPPHAPLANAAKPDLHSKRSSGRGASPPPKLVLDGVFALPQPPRPPSSSTSSSFARPRKLTSRRRPLSDRSNVPAGVSPGPSQSSELPRGGSGTGLAESSPRSKLAHVLTAHAVAQPQTLVAASGARTAVPPLVRGVLASNDPRTQCEIEQLRARRVVRLGRGGGGGGGSGGEGGGDGGAAKGAIERMSLVSVGVVARLRARWEAGNEGRSAVVSRRSCAGASTYLPHAG